MSLAGSMGQMFAFSILSILLNYDVLTLGSLFRNRNSDSDAPHERTRKQASDARNEPRSAALRCFQWGKARPWPCLQYPLGA